MNRRQNIIFGFFDFWDFSRFSGNFRLPSPGGREDGRIFPEKSKISCEARVWSKYELLSSSDDEVRSIWNFGLVKSQNSWFRVADEADLGLLRPDFGTNFDLSGHVPDPVRGSLDFRGLKIIANIFTKHSRSIWGSGSGSRRAYRVSYTFFV